MREQFWSEVGTSRCDIRRWRSAPSLPKYTSRHRRDRFNCVRMKTKLCVAVAVGVVGLALPGPGAEPSATVGATVASTPGVANAEEPIFKKLSDLKWDKILPD